MRKNLFKQKVAIKNKKLFIASYKLPQAYKNLPFTFFFKTLNYILIKYWQTTILSSLTFVPLVPGLALRARLISILSFILIARPADGESTNIASNERISIYIVPNIITTDLADLATQCSHWLCLLIGNGTKMHHWTSSINNNGTPNNSFSHQFKQKSNRKII